MQSLVSLSSFPGQDVEKISGVTLIAKGTKSFRNQFDCKRSASVKVLATCNQL